MYPRKLIDVARRLRRATGFYQTGRDPDIEQAWLRVAIATLGFAWCWYLVGQERAITPGLAMAMVAAGFAAAVGLGMIAVLRRLSTHPAALRYLGIFTDNAAISLGMAGADEGGVPMIGVYLWVTIGNGFRFGPKYLMASYWLSLLGFGLQLVLVPFWIQHRAIGVGLFLALVVVPLYVLVLLSRLTAQKDAAEQLSNAKSRFVANVSHELRTPLTGVFAVYDLLRARRMTPDERELVAMLGKSIATLRVSVDAILQMSKLEAGAEEMNARPFNLWLFVNQLAANLRAPIAAKRLGWTLQLAEDVPPIVVGDPDHLHHALSNLLNNAVKFTHAGSVSLRVSRAGDALRFEIEDTGIGIAVEQQEKIFDRFVQADSSATRRHSGTGLGTSIARDLVELMGGRIGVVSAIGRGSTFWIEIPCTVPFGGPLDDEPWGVRRQVVVVGEPSDERKQLVTRLVDLGLSVSAIAPSADVPADVDAQRCLALVLAMPPASAAQYAERNLAERDCPWIAFAARFEGAQRASLMKLGTAGCFALDLAPDELRLVFATLANRPALAPGREDAFLDASRSRPLTILLADDNPSNQTLLSRILRDAGHEATLADCGEDAYEVMAKGAIDLAILDLNMPDMTGTDVVKLYRAASIGDRKLPILILSADATPLARQESLAAGADDFLTKPVAAATLLATIDRLHAGAEARGGAGPLTAVDRATPAANDASTAVAAARAPAPQGLVDLDRLVSLRQIAKGDAAFLSTYVAAAFSEIESALASLRTAVDLGHARDARDALHVIEGTGGSIGGTQITLNCRSLRAALRANSVATRSLLAELSSTYALTKSAVTANLFEAANLPGPGSSR